jgi:hypothetical protein
MALDASNDQLAAVARLANKDGTVSALAVTRQLRTKYGIGIPPDSLSTEEKTRVARSRKNLTKKLIRQHKGDLLQHFKTLFKDHATRNMVASTAVNAYLLETADAQIKETGLRPKDFVEQECPRRCPQDRLRRRAHGPPWPL